MVHVYPCVILVTAINAIRVRAVCIAHMGMHWQILILNVLMHPISLFLTVRRNLVHSVLVVHTTDVNLV